MELNNLDPYLIRTFAIMVGASTFIGAFIGGIIYSVLKEIFNLIFIIKKCPLCDTPDFDDYKPSKLSQKLIDWIRRRKEEEKINGSNN